jgi:thiamine biosynthesis lipoprotein
MNNSSLSAPKAVSRRDFLKITAVAAGMAAGGGWMVWLQRPGRVHETRLLMGTLVNLTVVAGDHSSAQKALTATFAEMERLIALYTHRQSDSPLGRLNREGILLNPPFEVVNLLRKATYYSQVSDGAFDITVKPVLDTYHQGLALTPALLALVDFQKLHIAQDEVRFKQPGMQLTLDGIAKGAVVDGGVAVLQGLGFSNVLVEAGGDLVANGERDTQSPWKVGIENPRNGSLMAAIPVSGKALATSGDYQHAFTQDYSLNHILVPGSGLSPAELSSATVLAATATDADALATTLMVLGVHKSLALVNSLPGVEAMLISKSLETTLSAGFPKG